MKRDPPKPGRPPGKPYPVVKQLRLSERDAERLKLLAAKREKPEAWIMRELIREAAKREGLE
jgi:predicted DNA-binding protein